MGTILIVGFGDIAGRLAPRLATHNRVIGVIRDPSKAAQLRALGVIPVIADLDQPRSLQRLAGLASTVVHLAPPAARGKHDQRTRRLLAVLSQSRGMLPQRLVYIGTTGVLGDAGGAWIDETWPARPSSARAVRRMDAEQQLRAFAMRTGTQVILLRSPGIYAGDRLPDSRLREGLPVPHASEDSYTNHIHADDLARAIAAALARGKPSRVYHCVDDLPLLVGDYFDLVAKHLGLARPPRASREETQAKLSPAQWSFMQDSRRIHNDRLKRELRLRLNYPTVAQLLGSAT